MAMLERDRWERLQPLLDRALELSGEQRASWLDSLRSTDPGVADELDSLLSEESAADGRGFLSDPLEQVDASLVGREVGAYTIERPLGQGGMGTVWLARRTDGRFEGRAAVKLLNLALLTPPGQERFRREGSMLARLTHPGIARLLDAGVSGGGQPYLVLEYVEGERLDRYVAARQLSRDERIGLVLQVLAAVGHAHANLIVHRDIKPSNILVTADGTVKLLDFGIAKLVSTEESGDATLTAEGSRALTPEFAAPEQVLGEPVTTATDVYAVGVLLYLLLSGRHPTSGGRSATEAVAALLRVEPAGLGMRDLDIVLSKALRKTPAERYQTVAAFADDLRRFVRNEPVSARGDSLGYRARKFVQRNRAPVAAAGVSALALVGATLFSIAQAREAETQRDAAVRAAMHAQAMSQIQGVLANDVRHPDGRPLTAVERIDVAERMLTRHYRGTPWLVSALITDLSARLHELGDMQAERAMLARARTVALAADQPAQLAVADCRRAESFAFENLIDSARTAIAEAKQALSRPRISDDQAIVAACLTAEGKYLVAAGQRDSGIALLRRAVDVAKQRPDDLFRLEMMTSLASVLREGGRTREAIPYQMRVIAELDSLGHHDTDEIPAVLSHLTLSLSELGEYAVADSVTRSQVRAYEASHGRGGVPVPLAFMRARALLGVGAIDSADAWLAGPLTDTTTYPRAYTPTILAAAATELRIEQNRLDDAAVEAGRLAGTARGRRSTNAMLRARLLAARGDVVGASTLLEGELRAVAPDTLPSITIFALPFVTAGELRLAQRDARGADSLARRAIDVMRADSLAPRRSAFVGRAELLRARAFGALGDRRAARDAAERALAPLSAGYGPSNRWTLAARALSDSLGR